MLRASGEASDVRAVMGDIVDRILSFSLSELSLSDELLSAMVIGLQKCYLSSFFKSKGIRTIKADRLRKSEYKDIINNGPRGNRDCPARYNSTNA